MTRLPAAAVFRLFAYAWELWLDGPSAPAGAEPTDQLPDLLARRDSIDTQAGQALDAMTLDAEEAGLYEVAALAEGSSRLVGGPPGGSPNSPRSSRDRHSAGGR